jgi:hypothetical protein
LSVACRDVDAVRCCLVVMNAYGPSTSCRMEVTEAKTVDRRSIDEEESGLSRGQKGPARLVDDTILVLE